MTDYALDWVLANWQKLALAGLALFALLLLNRFLKQRPGEASATAAAAGKSAEREAGGEHAHESGDAAAAAEAEEAARRRRFAEAGPDLKEELAGLVRDDEEAAVNVLKAWISEAA